MKRVNFTFIVSVFTANIFTAGMFIVLNMPPLVMATPATVEGIREEPNHVTFSATTGTPVRIVIPSIGVDLKVEQGTFDNAAQTWTTSDNTVNYADVSVPLNDSNGTTLIYGHNRNDLFEPLKRISNGATVEVYSDNGNRFIYKYASSREVLPQDTSVFTDVGAPTLVLQTCSGPWDRYRALYSFDFVSVQKL